VLLSTKMSSGAKIGKLYYTPTSCGAANYITAIAAGVNFDSEQVNIQTHKTASGVDFYTINPKGNVPTLVLPDGTLLNENAATLQYIADQNPSSGLVPAAGTKERYLLINHLNWVSSELHTGIGTLFYPGWSEETKKHKIANATKKMNYLADELLAKGKKNFILGDKFTAVDAYAYIVLGWTGYLGIKIDDFPVLKAYRERVAALPEVKKAHDLMNAAPKAP